MFGGEIHRCLQKLLGVLVNNCGLQKAALISECNDQLETIINNCQGKEGIDINIVSKILQNYRLGVDLYNYYIVNCGKYGQSDIWCILRSDDLFEKNSQIIEIKQLVEVIKDVISSENRYNLSVFEQFKISYHEMYSKICNYILVNDELFCVILDVTTKKLLVNDSLKKLLNIESVGTFVDNYHFLRCFKDEESMELTINLKEMISGEYQTFQKSIHLKSEPNITINLIARVGNCDKENRPITIYFFVHYHRPNVELNDCVEEPCEEEIESQIGIWEYNYRENSFYFNDVAISLLKLKKSYYSFIEIKTILNKYMVDALDNVTLLEDQIRNSEVIDVEIEFASGLNKAEVFQFTGDANSNVIDENTIVSGYVRNITAIKQRAIDELNRQQMQSLGSLASSIAHDFNNILMASFGYLELLKNVKDLPEEALNYVTELEKIGNVQATSVNKMLRFSQKEVNDSEYFDIVELVEEIYALAYSSFSKKLTITSDYKIDKGLVYANRSGLQNAIYNIVVNAKDACNSDGNIQIEVKKSKVRKPIGTLASGVEFIPGTYIQIDITDNGSGIDNDVAIKMFNPFFTTKSPDKGTGLGLFNVLKIINSSKGMLSYDSVIGQGTTFHIFIPIANVKYYDKMKIVHQQEKIFNPRLYNIIIVDDDDLVASILQETLSKSGFTVTSFTNQYAAIDYYRNNYARIDIVILDMLMPGLNGDAVYLELKNIYEDVQAIILSGFSKDANEEKLSAIGITDYVQKPIIPAMLVEKIEEVVTRKPTPIYDEKLSLSLLAGMSKLQARFKESYLEQFKDFDSQIKKHLGSNNSEDLRLLIHRMRGVSLNVGCKEMYRYTSYLDEELREGTNINLLLDDINELVKINEKLLEELV